MSTPLAYDATLHERIDLSPSLAIFRVRLDQAPASTPWFCAGQYLVLGLNNESRPELGPVVRPLSLASSPLQSEFAEFYVRLVEKPATENPLTHLLWRLQPGDRLHAALRPAGKFTLRDTHTEDDPRLKVFVAAGTGLAPFVSIVRDRLDRQDPRGLRDLAILHSASYDHELGYKTWLLHCAREHGLRYVPTVSRADHCTTWDGCRGRVEDLFLPQYFAQLEEHIGLAVGALTPQSALVYVCGLRGTIAATLERLLPRGYVPERKTLAKALGFDRAAKPSFFFEQYDEEPLFDTRDPQEIARLQALAGRPS